jgi:hypothetical protein
MIKDAIRTLEAKGYRVIEIENKWMGKIDESCPVVYKIIDQEYETVYGCGGVEPETLTDLAESLPDLAPKAATTEKAHIATDAERAERAKKAKEYDDLYNEGGEGYNPYR